MNKVRNAVIIIILCLIGAGLGHRKVQISVTAPADIQDAIGGHQARRHIVLAPDHGEPLQDAVAGQPALPPRGKDSNTLDGISGPPRGSGFGGVAPLPADNRPPELSPHRPQ